METLHSLSPTHLSQTSVGCLVFEILEIPGAESALADIGTRAGERLINQLFSICGTGSCISDLFTESCQAYRRVYEGQSQMRDMLTAALPS
jgi:hypothetical protein